MTEIQDVSPTFTNTQSKHFSVSGRMLTLLAHRTGRCFLRALTRTYGCLKMAARCGTKWHGLNRLHQFGVSGSLAGWYVVDIAVSPESARWRSLAEDSVNL